MTQSLPQNIPLTGSDCFIYTLETHDRFTGTSGNTCRYIIELEGILDTEAFRKKLEGNAVFNWLSTFYLSKKGFFQNPRWANHAKPLIEVNTIESDEYIPKNIAARKFNKASPPLLVFDIVKRKDNATTVIYSWHHLLMDGYGAALSLKYLLKGLEPKNVKIEKFSLSFPTFWQAVRAKFFVQFSASGKLTDIAEITKKQEVKQQLKVISFSEVETETLEKSALAAGAKFGASAYYLTCCARAVKSVLKSRGEKADNDFWIPVPQDQRKKGSLWPIVGNHLSFLFYRITSKSLDDMKTAVAEFNEQMIRQIKIGMPQAYDYLIKYLRRIPTPLYYFWIKGPNGKSLSSFLFTVAADHPKDLDEFEGHKITNVLSLPPSTYPPGLTFAFMKFNDRLQLAILYYDEVISAEELALLEVHLKLELVSGERFERPR